MPVFKTIVCLANSRKWSARCVAGKELSPESGRPWIRPVGNTRTGEVQLRDQRCKDGTEPAVLDIIRVPLKEHQPWSYQSENWLLYPGYRWARQARLACNGLSTIADSPATLWSNGYSTLNGRNDRLPQAEAETLTRSLYLVPLPAVRIRVFVQGAKFGEPKRRIQAMFGYNGVRYSLRVTDPVIERKFLTRDMGEYDLGDCFATISLGEPYKGYVYKLVAALIMDGPTVPNT